MRIFANGINDVVMTHKIKIYLDTSVYGGFFEKEFEEHTKPLFEIRSPREFAL